MDHRWSVLQEIKKKIEGGVDKRKGENLGATESANQDNIGEPLVKVAQEIHMHCKAGSRTTKGRVMGENTPGDQD